MNGKNEPLPGLLDDPQFQLPDLPFLAADFHIAPLRDPAPLRHLNAPLPLEPVTDNAINAHRSARNPAPANQRHGQKKASQITPNDVILAREAKKPYLAISEIIDHHDDTEGQLVQLPSFVSLSVVERSPVQAPSAITRNHISKRPRLDQDVDITSHDLGRQLPRPSHKEHPQTRPAPLLPAMVTGLHEPPPSAGLLPSMDLDQRPTPTRVTPAKINVKDMLLTDIDDDPSPNRQTTSAPSSRVQLSDQLAGASQQLRETEPSMLSLQRVHDSLSDCRDIKVRRARRRWTDNETKDLLLGVRKHGIGRWKQILDDKDFKFTERTTVDLKDRYRVAKKEKEESQSSPTVLLSNGTKEGPKNGTDAPSQTVTEGTNIQRRKRRAWTPGEDERLIQGIQKHGFQWTNIHDDTDLDLGHRRATDLRDRIRNKYPEGYRQAESAPLRSEVRKATKAKAANKRQSAETQMTVADDLISKDREKEQTHVGLTLPSLTFEDDMDWDNTLPPLEGWEDL